VEIVEEEVQTAGGSIQDCQEAREELYIRALLPHQAEVRPGDQVVDGLALRTTGEEIEVRHYLLRRVCINGAISAKGIWERSIPRIDEMASPGLIAKASARLRAAIRAGLGGQQFDTAIASMRASQLKPADMAVFRRWAETCLPRQRLTELQASISRRFAQAGDRTLFGLINAVTSVARDEGAPEVRWRLEELAGVVLSSVNRRKPTPAQHARQTA